VNNSGSLTIEAPRMTGRDSKNAKSDATEWFNLLKRPALIVTPKRLMPANKAKLWPNPITTALLTLTL
jgi:hypothetical protein